MDHASVNQWLGNVFSAGAIIASVIGLIPVIAAFVGLIYYLIQIYETKTVQRWVHARRSRKIARLKARVMMMEARTLAPYPNITDDHQ